MQPVLIIVGPTAVGKTRLALLIARQLRAEIISADSRQIYRRMDIGTAKPTPEEQQQVPHHFIDIKNPDEDYSAGAYGQDARERIARLQQQNQRVVVVGGAGFYIRALVDGLQSPPVSDPELKQKLRQRLEQEGLESLYQELQRIDPVAADQIHPNDTQRVLRALEVYYLTGAPFSIFQNRPQSPAPFKPYFVGLTRARNRLYQMIEARVEAMIAAGLVSEVRALQAQGYRAETNALQTVGYQEVFAYLNGNLTFETMVAEIKKNTRRYAKRQWTWFHADPRIEWFDPDAYPEIELLAKIIVEKVK
ncbi:tRNA (adenosine(37)-N6)-dimethylallyltransferase MiaA [candidate division KSB1 bacterium]|nr:tRNA (adenosine(37)-N6)-dimethylallyltransferase MiaA [candidate division KSB1 bacterium]